MQSRVALSLVLLAATVLLATVCSVPLRAQDSRTESESVISTTLPLITQPVDETQVTILHGNTHRLARPEFDLGTAPASLPMMRMLLVLKRSPEQEFALRKLLDDQQDKKSPNYHKWLTPEQFGKHFGPSDADMQTITSWLQSHSFQVGSTKGRSVLEFSGSASQVQEAFHTAIHKYIVNGEQHWANASDPSIPTALASAVAGVKTLHNFISKPQILVAKEPALGRIIPGKKPQVTFPPQNGQPALNALAPQDYAVVYNINPAYNQFITGQRTRIGVVGRSNLFNGGEDVQDFRNSMGAGNGSFGGVNFAINLNGPDPGDLGGNEEAEATLDSTWSSTLAPDAFVQLVVSATTNSTDGVDLSELYIVENNLSDIMTESFGSCEYFATDAQLAGTSALAEQAAAQGITYFVSTGDNGAEGCDDPSSPPATGPVSVNLLASTAFNVAVGGTMFNEGGNPSKYWTSAAPISETALSYIPEDVWNESSPTNGLWSSGGGASAGNLGDVQISPPGTTAGVPKPSWQFGASLNIPNDGVRDLPDVSLTGAAHDPYLLCLEASCVPDSQGFISVFLVSGTSASAPSFAGIMALVDQQMSVTNPQGVRQGQANYVLYPLAAAQSSYPSQCNGSSASAPPRSSCIFNDVTVGNNVVPGEIGNSYQAGIGYDLATGLGSVNVANLVSNWNSVTFNPTTTALLLNGVTSGNTTPLTVSHGTPVNLSGAVTSNNGTGTPTGDVSLIAATGGVGSISAQTGLGPFTLTAGGAITGTTSLLPGGGPYFVTAHYAGIMTSNPAATFAPSDSASPGIQVTVTPENSTTTLTGPFTQDQFGQFTVPFSSAPFGSPLFVRADVVGLSGQGFPTGTVNFTTSTGTIPNLSSSSLNGQGTAALISNPNVLSGPTVPFDAGSYTISAAYAGDNSFNASNSTAPVSFTITPGFFSAISSSQSFVLISSPGQSSTTSMTVTNSSGFKGTISLACSQGLPAEATCTFTPASIKANGTSGSTTVSILVNTKAPVAMTQPQQRPYFVAHWIAGFGLVLSFVMLGSPKKQPSRLLFLCLLLALVVVVPGCGGGGSHTPPPPPPDPGTPAGSYNVTVTATSGSAVATTGFALTVQ
jgi:hypothetical protein